MRLDIRKEELEALREKYPQGCRVELVRMDDPTYFPPLRASLRPAHWTHLRSSRCSLPSQSIFAGTPSIVRNGNYGRRRIDMAMQQKSPGNAHQKRNCWQRGNGSYSMRGDAPLSRTANICSFIFSVSITFPPVSNGGF